MQTNFQSINRGYNDTFRPNRLSLGVVVPIENYANSAVPTMDRHLQLVQSVERLGFSAIWLRDVPFNVPSFGDATGRAHRAGCRQLRVTPASPGACRQSGGQHRRAIGWTPDFRCRFRRPAARIPCAQHEL